MLFEFMESALSVGAILVGIAAFFWTVLTLVIRRVNKGEITKTVEEETEELELEIDNIVAETLRKSGQTNHPPITS